ncbi:MAG: DUF1501 domain-containing protein [Acidobacteria bacterium]|nr:DUF1501 domain-containing protein [Acidobacteriota bacterium]
MQRRQFIKAAGVALAGATIGPRFWLRPASASGGKTLVVVFMRGAVDGLNLVVPYSEDRYYTMRRSIAIAKPGESGGALDLDGDFGLHPSAEPLVPLWQSKSLALIHACGSPDPTRSHFSAMASMESGTPGSTGDGWINRYLQGATGQAVFRAVFVGGALPHAMLGDAPALALGSLKSLQMGKGERGAIRFAAIERMYSDREDAVGEAGRESMEAIEAGKHLNPDEYQPSNGAVYPVSSFGAGLKQIAQMIKAGVGLEVAETDIDGWDTHANQGGSTGQMARLIGDWASSLRAFEKDLGGLMQDVVLVTMSEFGRTASENGSGGTDHGHGTVMLAMGGPVVGSRVYGRWPGLHADQLYDSRDLAVTTDFRLVLSEVLDKHLGCSSIGQVFPGFTYEPKNALGIIQVAS